MGRSRTSYVAVVAFMAALIAWMPLDVSGDIPDGPDADDIHDFFRYETHDGKRHQGVSCEHGYEVDSILESLEMLAEVDEMHECNMLPHHEGRHFDHDERREIPKDCIDQLERFLHKMNAPDEALDHLKILERIVLEENSLTSMDLVGNGTRKNKNDGSGESKCDSDPLLPEMSLEDRDEESDVPLAYFDIPASTSPPAIQPAPSLKPLILSI